MLRIRPIGLRDANAFVRRHHRHHKADKGCKFAIAVYSAGELVGVAITGRPKARLLNGKAVWIAEVTRVCTNGFKNACSKLYGASARIAREMGYDEVKTYILDSETGISLKASGWEEECDEEGQQKTFGGGTWNRPNSDRLREDKHPTQPKRRFRKVLAIPREEEVEG